MKGIFVSDDGCVVCMEANVEVCLFTCKHACVCQSCSDLLKKKPNALCPMCRQNISYTKLIKNLNDHDEKPTIIAREEREKYLITRAEFIEKFNLKTQKSGTDLVITAERVVNFDIDEDVANETFEYYLGTSIYNSSKMHVMHEHDEEAFLFEKGELKESKSKSVKLTFKKFFETVTENIIAEKKLYQHLIDQYFQDYLVFLLSGVKKPKKRLERKIPVTEGNFSRKTTSMHAGQRFVFK